MAIAKTTDRGTTYHTVDANNNRFTIKQGASAASSSVTLDIQAGVSGGIQQLTQQNAIDLLPILTAFANTGRIP
jgi:phage-related protein